MASSTEYVIFSVLGVILVSFALLLLTMGPVGWVVSAFFVLSFIVLLRWSGVFAGRSVQQPLNCPSCGAANSPDSTACEYCHQPLPTDETA